MTVPIITDNKTPHCCIIITTTSQQKIGTIFCHLRSTAVSVYVVRVIISNSISHRRATSASSNLE